MRPCRCIAIMRSSSARTSTIARYRRSSSASLIGQDTPGRSRPSSSMTRNSPSAGWSGGSGASWPPIKVTTLDHLHEHQRRILEELDDVLQEQRALVAVDD